MAIAELFANTGSSWATKFSLTTNSTTLGAETTDNVIQVFLDVSAMALGDTYEILISEKCRSGGTQRKVYEAYVVGVQAQPLWVSPSLIVMHGWDVTLQKIAGTDRAIEWSIRSVA